MATQLLDLTKVNQPFNLATALSYMCDNGEFIRYKKDDQDFYIYKDVQKRPAIIDGKRQFVEVETVWTFNKWGGTATTLNVSELFDENFYIMTFDESGNPDWSEPLKKGRS